MDMQTLNSAKVYARKKSAEMAGSNFKDMVFKSRDNITGEVTYTATYIKDGKPYDVDIVFKDGKDGVKGEKGDKGDTGSKGDIGLKGDKGEKGDTGATGGKGDKGDGAEFGSLTDWDNEKAKKQVPNVNETGGMLNKINNDMVNVTKENVSIYVILPSKNYDYSGDAIGCESYGTGKTLGEAKLKDFINNGNGTLSGNISLLSDYNGYLYINTTLGQFTSKPFITQVGRDEREFTITYTDKVQFVQSIKPESGVQELIAEVDTKEVINVKKIITNFTDDSKINLVNFVNGNETQLGNGNTSTRLISMDKKSLLHNFSDGIKGVSANVSADKLVPKDEYVFYIDIKNKDNSCITKILLTSLDDEIKEAAEGRIEILNKESVVIWQSCEKGSTVYFSDMTTNSVNGQMSIDIKNPIPILKDEILQINFTVINKRLFGGIGTNETIEPSVILEYEGIKTNTIASMEDIAELNPNSISNSEIFELVDCNEDLALNRVYLSKELISPYGRVVVPHHRGTKKVRWMQYYIPDKERVMNEFIAESIEYIEYVDTTEKRGIFEQADVLEKIYLPNVTDILTNCFARDCKRLKEIYVPNLNTVGENFIDNCPNVVVYTKSKNVDLINNLHQNSIKYVLLDIPMVELSKSGSLLRINDYGSCEWGDIPVHTHKFTDITDITETINSGNFDTSITKTGSYRMTNVMLNLPNSDYKVGDNDFIVKAAFVDNSDKFGGITVQDIRSTRCFIRNKNNGTWGGWREFVINTNNPWNSEGTNLDTIASVCEMAIKNAIGSLPTGIVAINNIYVKTMVVNGLMRQILYDMSSLKEFHRIKNSTWQAWVEK